MQAVLAKADIDPDKFNWHLYDADKDGRLNEEEFLQAGPAALAATFPKDQRVFKSSDLDGSGFLEENEMNKVLTDAGIDPDNFNWFAFDHDGDGRLSETEFLESGPAAAQAAKQENAPKRVFRALDVDGNQILSGEEVDRFMKEMNILPEHWNWHFFDTDGDGGLSEKEFIAAGPAIADASLVQAAPKRIFGEADQDGNSYLEPAEIDALMRRSGLHPAHFNWRSFDHDGDGRLNFAEFLKAGPAAASSPQQPPPPSQQGPLGPQGEPMTPASPDEVFKGTDRDSSGFLEAQEMDHLVQQAGIPPTIFNWRSFDHDGDGKLNLSEFYEADRAVLSMPPPPQAQSLAEEQIARQAQQNQQDQEAQHAAFLEQTKQIFQETDSDGSNFLEPGEIEEFLMHVGNPHEPYDWHGFDQDKDGRLSEVEFQNAGPAAVQAARSQHRKENGMDEEDVAALLETDDGPDAPVTLDQVDLDKDDDEEDEGKAQLKTSDQHPAADGADDLFVYKDTDLNKDGFCDASELARMEKVAGIKDVDWRKFDTDKDGKLSKKEFMNYCQLAKDHASLQYKRHIQVETGEIDKDKAKAGKVDPANGWAETLPAEGEKNSDVPPPLKPKGASAAVSSKVDEDGSIKSLMRAADQRKEQTAKETKANANLKKELQKQGISAGKVNPDDESALQISADAMLRTAQRHVHG
jgi:Ca2+-binding EF-hand superfamily protein